MSESNKNELDKLFQSRFSNDTAADNGWNVPPIDLFDNAMNALEPQEEEDKKPFWFIFIFSGLILSGLVFMFVYNNIMFDKLDTKIEHLQSQSNDSNTNNSGDQNTPFINEINSIDQSSNTEGTAASNNTQKLFNDKLSKDNPNNVVNNKNSDVKSSTITRKNTNQTIAYKDLAIQSYFANNVGLNALSAKPTSNNKYENPIETLAQNTLLSEQKEEVLIPTIEPTNNINPIQSLGIDLLNKNLGFPILDDQGNQINPEDVANIRRFEPYLLIGSHLSSFAMKGDGMDNATLTEYDQYCVSYQLGIGFVQTLSPRWALDYSVSYKNLINHSIYNDQTNYKKSNEYFNDFGSLMYADEMSVVSPTGIFKDNVNIPVQVNEMQDGDILKNTTNTTQLFHIVQASLGANYTAIKTGNFGLSLNGGLGFNYILNAKQDMDTEVYFDNKLMTADSYSIQPNFNGNNIFYSGYVGLGLKYQVSPNLSLTLDNRFERSLNSLNTIQSANAPSTLLNSINTGLKVGFRF